MYAYNAETDELLNWQSGTGGNNWIRLPQEYQEKNFDDISAVRWDGKIIVAHPDLKPQMWHRGKWLEMDAVKGTLPVMTNGLLSFKTPRLSPTEQRDAFQKEYPHLVKHLQNVGNIKLDPFGAPQDVGLPVEEYLPKEIRDQLAESPLHYRKGKIQPWDFITSQGMSFLEGNIIKYVTRYKHKGGAEDLKKARTYLDKLISEVTCVRNSDG